MVRKDIQWNNQDQGNWCYIGVADCPIHSFQLIFFLSLPNRLVGCDNSRVHISADLLLPFI